MQYEITHYFIGTVYFKYWFLSFQIIIIMANEVMMNAGKNDDDDNNNNNANDNQYNSIWLQVI